MLDVIPSSLTSNGGRFLRSNDGAALPCVPFLAVAFFDILGDLVGTGEACAHSSSSLHRGMYCSHRSTLNNSWSILSPANRTSSRPFQITYFR